MTVPQPQPSYDELVALVAQLRQTIVRLEARVQQLEAELATERRRNHGDKGPPPPSAAPFAKPHRKLNPKSPGRKPGEGRFERRRAPVPTEPPIEVPAPPPGRDCPHCGAEGELRPYATELPTITELPPPVPRVRQFRRAVLRCRCCEKLVRGRHPELAPNQHGANSHQFGPRAKAAMLILYGAHGVPVNHVPPILETLTGITTTPSTVVQLAQQATSESAPLGKAAAEFRANVAASDETYMDATGWRVKGEKAQLVGVEGVSAERESAVNYEIVKSHDAAHRAKMLGVPAHEIERAQQSGEPIAREHCPKGTCKTDGLPMYAATLTENFTQDRCTRHVANLIKRAMETAPAVEQAYGAVLRGVIAAAHEVREWHIAGRLTRDEFDNQADLVIDRWHDLMYTKPPSRHWKTLFKGLRRQWEAGAWFNFLYDPRLEPTNNRAERVLRPPVVQRKVSQCSRSWPGATSFASLKTVLETLRRRGANLLAAVAAMLTPAPSPVLAR